jgi:hypothetical protein
MLSTGNIYLHKILGITLYWALWENLFTQNTGDYFLLNIVGRFIYTKYWGILDVEHCGEIYLHKILGITLCWALWENLFTQNIGDYFTLNTVGRFTYTKYCGILYVEHRGKIYLHKIPRYNVCWAVGIFIYTTYWGLLYGEHCGNIYLHKILRNIVCWALWEDLFTQNTKEYCMLSTVGRFIYTKYWGILYVEHCEKIYLHKIPRNTLCWALWEDLFTQNTEEYFMLNTVRRFIYTKYWGLLLVEHCGKIYLHKIPRKNVCLSTVGRFI